MKTKGFQKAESFKRSSQCTLYVLAIEASGALKIFVDICQRESSRSNFTI